MRVLEAGQPQEIPAEPGSGNRCWRVPLTDGEESIHVLVCPLATDAATLVDVVSWAQRTAVGWAGQFANRPLQEIDGKCFEILHSQFVA